MAPIIIPRGYAELLYGTGFYGYDLYDASVIEPTPKSRGNVEQPDRRSSPPQSRIADVARSRPGLLSPSRDLQPNRRNAPPGRI